MHRNVTPTGLSSGVRDHTRRSAWCDDCGASVRQVGDRWEIDADDEDEDTVP